MEKNQNNQKAYRTIAIVSCAVVVIAVGILLGYKLTKKDTPKETSTVAPTEVPKETPTYTPTEAPKNTPTPSYVEPVAWANGWVMSKKYRLREGVEYCEEYLRGEYFYDEQGRLAEEKCYDAQGSLDYTDYYSYDYDGERVERWQPDRDGKLYSATIWDMSGEIVVHVDGHNGETYQEDFYDDGFIKEFRVYGNSDNPAGEQSEKNLVKVVKWECDDERKNISRMQYRVHSDGELEPVGELQIELDSEGCVARCVDYGHPNGVWSATEYRYEGNRRIGTVTWGRGTDEYENGPEHEFVYEGNRFASSRKRMNDGAVRVTECFYPNVNWHLSGFLHEYLESVTEIAKDGTETPRYKVEFTNDGQPLRTIEVETGAVLEEYQYGADGKLCAVLTWNPYLDEPGLTEAADIELDQYGNLVKYDDYRLGVCERFEWIRLPDAEHKKD